MNLRIAAICLWLLCAASFTRSAWASPSEADRATARALALEGHAALEKKDFATAADRFGRADALVHAPTLVVDWARALQGLGHLVEAHEKYELVLREGVPEAAPKSWVRSLEDAKSELDALKPRLAWVTVILKDPPDASVKLGGVAIPPAAIGVKRAADPGSPDVTVSAPGYEPFRETLTVGPGEEKTIEIALKKLRAIPASTPASSDVNRPRRHSGARRAASYVLLSVGGAGLIAGGVTGGLAWRERSWLKSHCLGERCRSTAQNRIDHYHLYGTISGAALGVGVAGLGAGLVLLFTEPDTTDDVDAALKVRPLLGLGVLGAEGTF